MCTRARRCNPNITKTGRLPQQLTHRLKQPQILFGWSVPFCLNAFNSTFPTLVTCYQCRPGLTTPVASNSTFLLLLCHVCCFRFVFSCVHRFNRTGDGAIPPIFWWLFVRLVFVFPPLTSLARLFLVTPDHGTYLFACCLSFFSFRAASVGFFRNRTVVNAFQLRSFPHRFTDG